MDTLIISNFVFLSCIEGSSNRAQRSGFFARLVFPHTASNRFRRVVVYNRRDAKRFYRSLYPAIRRIIASIVSAVLKTGRERNERRSVLLR